MKLNMKKKKKCPNRSRLSPHTYLLFMLSEAHTSQEPSPEKAKKEKTVEEEENEGAHVL